MTTTVDNIDLKKFCAREPGKYVLDRPYIHNGYRYACDGRILIRVPASGQPDDELPEGFKADMHQRKLDENAGGDWRPWPVDAAYVEKDAECLVCDGTGLIERIECTACDGEGSTECRECGQDVDCRKCDCRGFVGGKRCPNCGGHKHGVLAHHKLIRDVPISIRYVRMIEEFLELEYCHDAPSEGEYPPIWFRFAGGIGIVMPIKI